MGTYRLDGVQVQGQASNVDALACQVLQLGNCLVANVPQLGHLRMDTIRSRDMRLW